MMALLQTSLPDSSGEYLFSFLLAGENAHSMENVAMFLNVVTEIPSRMVKSVY